MSSSRSSLGRERTSSSLVGAFGGQIVVAACRGAGLVAAARTLGPSDQGKLALALSAPGVLALIFGLGLPAAHAVFAAREPSSVARLISQSVWMAALTGALGILAAVGAIASGVASVLLPEVPTDLVVVSVAQLPVILLRANLSGVLQGMNRVLLVVWAEIAEAVVLLLLIGLVLIVGAESAVSFAICYLVASLVGTAMIVRSGKAHGQLFSQAGRKPVQGSISFGLRANGANIIQLATYRVDLFLVNGILGSARAGQYAVATRIAELVMLLPAAVTRVLLPRVSGSTSVQGALVTTRLFWLSAWSLTVGALLLGGFAPILIPLMFGDAYQDAVTPLWFLLPGVVAVASSAILSTFTAGRGRPELNLLNSAVGLGLVVILDVVLIRTYGLPGASLASSIAYGCNLLLAVIFFSRIADQAVLTLLRSSVKSIRGLREPTSRQA